MLQSFVDKGVNHCAQSNQVAHILNRFEIVLHSRGCGRCRAGGGHLRPAHRLRELWEDFLEQIRPRPDDVMAPQIIVRLRAAPQVWLPVEVEVFAIAGPVPRVGFQIDAPRLLRRSAAGLHKEAPALVFDDLNFRDGEGRDAVSLFCWAAHFFHSGIMPQDESCRDDGAAGDSGRVKPAPLLPKQVQCPDWVRVHSLTSRRQRAPVARGHPSA